MPCTMCGRCCRISIATVPEADWDEELEGLLVLKGKRYLDTLDGQRRYAYWSPCPHLDLVTDECTIHEYKPKVCRDYPSDPMTVLPGCGYARNMVTPEKVVIPPV